MVLSAFRFDLAGLIGGGVILFRWRNMHVDSVLCFQEQSMGSVLCLEKGGIRIRARYPYGPKLFVDYTGSVMLNCLCSVRLFDERTTFLRMELVKFSFRKEWKDACMRNFLFYDLHLFTIASC